MTKMVVDMKVDKVADEVAFMVVDMEVDYIVSVYPEGPQTSCTKYISISILYSSQGRFLETEDNKGEVNEQGADSINQSSDMKMLSKKGQIYFYLWFVNLKKIMQRCK